MLTKFQKLILKPLPKNDYPVLNTFLLVSCWIGFALDKSIVSMRDLCTKMNIQRINVQISTFSKASKIRKIDVFEKIITELNKRLSIKKGVEKARVLFSINSIVISLTSKLLCQEKWHQVKLFFGLNSITSKVRGIEIYFRQRHDFKEGKKTIQSIPQNTVGVTNKGFTSNKRVKELLGNKEKHFVLKIKNSVTLEMLENGKGKVGKGKDEIEVRVVIFCELEEKTEFRLATDLASEREEAVSNEEIAEVYVQRWQIELIWKFLKMCLKLDSLITKNENGIRIQIYSCIIAYLILQLIDIEERFGKSLLDKLRYLQSFRCQHTSYVHWLKKIVYTS